MRYGCGLPPANDAPAPLRAAGLASAKTAIFTPALPGTRPVAVGDMSPGTFQLSR